MDSPLWAEALIPRCHPKCRLEILGYIDHLIAVDAAGVIRDLVDEGWVLDDAVRAVSSDYRAWLHGRLDEAITFGVEFGHIQASAA